MESNVDTVESSAEVKNKKYLVFDTETTGLPKNWSAPVTDTDNWPRLVQLAWQQYDEDGVLLEEQETLVIPEGFLIPEESTKIHGITTEQAVKEGDYLPEVLVRFYQMVYLSDVVVAHNMAFDEKIMTAEFIRKSKTVKLLDVMELRPKVCTMISSVDFYGKGKWPKLSELHIKLFDKDFEDAHDAMVDTSACARCFFELKKKGIIEI